MPILKQIFALRNRHQKSEPRDRKSDAQDKELRNKLLQLEYELLNTRSAYDKLKKENQRLNDVIAEKKYAQKEKSDRWRQHNMAEEAAEETAEEKIRNHLSRYYHINDTLMNKSESRMFFYINESINNLLNEKDRDFYILFPQVSLHAFINRIESVSKTEEDLLSKILGGKNVDFVLCHRNYNHYPSRSDMFYFYTPILMIEIDGPAHFKETYSKERLQKTQENDRLKNHLAINLNLPLLRYRLSDGKISSADKTGINTALRKFFSDHSVGQTDPIYYCDRSGFLRNDQYYGSKNEM